MTLLRQLALKLSTRMIEFAPPSRKDFAAGLAREAEFIPGDWRALAWSFGSLRVLFDRKAAREDHPYTSHLGPLVEGQWSTWLILLPQACVYTFCAVRDHDVAGRVGNTLLALSVCYWIVASCVDALRKNGAPRSGDLQGQRLYAQADLQRRLRRARSLRRWQAAFPVMAAGIGLPLLDPGGIPANPVYSAIMLTLAGLVAFALTAINYSPRKIQRQLVRFSALITKPDATQSPSPSSQTPA